MSMLVCHNEKMGKTSIRGMEIHNNRESENSKNIDIDPERTHLNYDLAEEIRNGRTYTETFNDIMADGYKSDQTIRKDAVCLSSLIVSSDSEFFKELPREHQEKFFKTTYDYLSSRVGEKNVIAGSCHFDEKTPHLHFQFVPLTEDGRLCAKEVVNRQFLTSLQRELPRELQRVGFEIEPGVTRSEKVRHRDTYEWKAAELERKTKELDTREQELTKREAEVNRRYVDEKKISMSQGEVDFTTRSAKEKTTGFINKEVRVELPKEDFDKLAATARSGAMALQENRKLETEIEKLNNSNKEHRNINLQLENENAALKNLVTDQQRILAHPQVSKEVYTVQNPHLVAYKELQRELRLGQIHFGTDKFEEAAIRLGRANFSREQIQEALRQDLNRDEIYNVMASASAKLQAEKVREQEKAAAAAKTAEQERKAQEQQEYLDRNPYIKVYDSYKARGLNPQTIAYAMTKIDNISPAKVERAFGFDGVSGYEAQRALQLARDGKNLSLDKLTGQERTIAVKAEKAQSKSIEIGGR